MDNTLPNDNQNTAAPGSSDLEDITITQNDQMLVDFGSPVDFPGTNNTAVEDDTGFFYKYFMIYPAILALTPLMLSLPLATAAYLIIRYDTQARGKMIERIRSVLFLTILIVVFVITIVSTFPIWSTIGAVFATIGMVVMGLVGPPVVMLVSGVFVVSRFIQ